MTQPSESLETCQTEHILRCGITPRRRRGACRRYAGFGLCIFIAATTLIMAPAAAPAATEQATDRPNPVGPAATPSSETASSPALDAAGAASSVNLPEATDASPLGESTSDPEANRQIALGDQAWGNGQHAVAAAAYQAALSRLKPPQDERLRANLSLRVGVSLGSLPRYADAEPAVRTALDFYALHQVEDRYAAVAEAALAEICANTGRASEALPHQERAVKLFKQERGSTDEATLSHTERLAEIQFQGQQFHAAADTFAPI